MTSNVRETEIPDDWMKDIQKVVKKVVLDWPGIIEHEDLVQDVHLHILESPQTQQDLAGMCDNSRYQTLNKIAQRIASQERTEYEYFSGNFRYSVNEVRKVLNDGVLKGTKHPLQSTWSEPGQAKSATYDIDPVLSSVSAQQDLLRGLETLAVINSWHAELIERRYLRDEVFDADSKEKKALSRALTSLTAKMNHGHKQQHVGSPEPYKSLGDGPGTRKAITNSASRFLSKEGWDSDYTPAPAHLRDNHTEPEIWQ